jgi:4-diphosphocytidyl-2-C-methyl-D-erythritol kinase
MLRVPAPAKINLFLHVGERRADGYHALESLVCFAAIGDELRLAPAEALTLSIEGPFARELESNADNLILKAARALALRTGCRAGAALTLVKNLPVASGIGGGSADAAAVLRGLSKLWNLGLEDSRLHEIALSLGSDVPVCLKSVPALMEGRGERVTAVGALPLAPMLLVNPGVAVSTAEVFRRLGRTASDRLEAAPAPPGSGWGGGSLPPALLDYLARTRNDLETPAREGVPAIGTVLDALARRGAALARMCGSGATCYALFADDAAAAKVADAIAAAHPEWWVAATRIAPPDIAEA